MRDRSTYRADLQFAKIQESRLDTVDLRDVYLDGTDFKSSHLNDADLREAYCYMADFPIARMCRTDFRRANLTKANFRAAHLMEANFAGADLREANFSEADLTGAIYDDNTQFDADVDPAAMGMIYQANALEGADFPDEVRTQPSDFLGRRGGRISRQLDHGLESPPVRPR